MRLAASAHMLPAGLDGPALFLRLAQRWPAQSDEHGAGHEPARDQRTCADGGYAGAKLRDAIARSGQWTIEIIKRSDQAKGFKVLPRF